MAKSENIERIYNVPLRSGWAKVPRYKRAKKAVKTLREFLAKHMKSDNIVIGREANEFIWKNGIKNPPHHIKIKTIKDDVEVFAELEDKFEKAYKQRIEIREKEDKNLEKRLSPLEQKKAELQKLTSSDKKDDNEENKEKTENKTEEMKEPPKEKQKEETQEANKENKNKEEKKETEKKENKILQSNSGDENKTQ